MSDPVLPSSDAELDRLLAARAAAPPDAPGDLSAWDFLLRLPVETQRGPVRASLVRLLGHADEAVRRRAISFLVDVGGDAAQSFGALAESARRELAWYRAHPAVGEALAQALASFAARARREREASQLVRMLCEPALPPPGAISTAALFEPAYVRRALAQAGPGAGDRAAADVADTFAIYRRDELLELLSELRGLSQPAKEAVLLRVANALAVPAATVEAMVKAAGLPAARATLTVPACREAIGV